MHGKKHVQKYVRLVTITEFKNMLLLKNNKLLLIKYVLANAVVSGGRYGVKNKIITIV